jgi:sulfate adenylyltransferase
MDGTEIPEWFSFPEVVGILRDAYPPKNKQGFTIFFTGLPSSGKSTLANVLMSRLMEITSRPVTLLDGDLVRKHLSSELGFSKEHRDLNIKRIGYVASEITKHRGIAICAPIAPYSETREEIRSIIEQYGKFILIHVATPLEICELRDLKGLYAKARAGQITGFTGIDDPYESPESPELRIDTSMLDPKDAIENVMKYLEGQGLLDIRNDC